MAKAIIPGGGGGADLDVITALSGDVLSPKVIVDKDGNPIKGTIPTIAGKTITPSESAQTAVEEKTYVSGAVCVASIPTNHVGSGITRQAAKTVTPSESAQTAVASGVYTTGAVGVAAIPTNHVGSGITRQAAKTVTPSESAQTAVASGVYTTGAVGVAAIPTTHVGSGIPRRTGSNISVSAAGLITASSGYYASNGTKQMTTFGAQTINPGTSAKSVATSGKYGTGNISVAACSLPAAANLKKGVVYRLPDGSSVTGTYEGFRVYTNGRWGGWDRTGSYGYTDSGGQLLISGTCCIVLNNITINKFKAISFTVDKGYITSSGTSFRWCLYANATNGSTNQSNYLIGRSMELAIPSYPTTRFEYFSETGLSKYGSYPSMLLWISTTSSRPLWISKIWLDEA